MTVESRERSSLRREYRLLDGIVPRASIGRALLAVTPRGGGLGAGVAKFACHCCGYLTLGSTLQEEFEWLAAVGAGIRLLRRV